MTYLVPSPTRAPMVTLVRRIRTASGSALTREVMPDWMAAHEALYGLQNGLTVLGCWIEHGPYLDRYGGSA